MKKPPFSQLRGTSAQKLRNRICWSMAVGFSIITGLVLVGIYQFAPPFTTHVKGPGHISEPMFKRRKIEYLKILKEEEEGKEEEK